MKKLVDVTVLETAHFHVGQDWEVPIVGFFVIGSKRRIKSILDFGDEEALEFIRLVRFVRKGMKEILGIDDVYFFQNEDSEHEFHLWIFPRHKWMDSFGRKIQSVRPIMEYAKKEMADEKHVAEVKDAAQKVRTYLSSAKQ